MDEFFFLIGSYYRFVTKFRRRTSWNRPWNICRMHVEKSNVFFLIRHISIYPDLSTSEIATFWAEETLVKSKRDKCIHNGWQCGTHSARGCDWFFFWEWKGQVTVNGEGCRTIVTEFLWTRFNSIDTDELCFQQDGLHCHSAVETIARIVSFHFRGRGEIGPGQEGCVILLHMIFFLRGFVKSQFYKKKLQTINNL